MKKNTCYMMNKSLIRKIGSYSICLSLLLPAMQANAQQQISVLQKSFITPPDSVRPSVYWYWLSGNISPEGVVKDIEAMKKVGIGRAFIGNIGLGPDEVPQGPVKFFSDEWWKTTKAAITAASKAGIEIGMFNGPGWSQSGGPWISPSQSMRYLAGEELHVKGPIQFSQKLAAAKENFQDVAVLAFPVPVNEGQVVTRQNASVTLRNTTGAVQPAKDNSDIIFASNNATTAVNIEIKSKDTITARSIILYFITKPFKAQAELQVNENGNFRTIKQFEIDRINPEKNVGFVPYAPIALSFDATNSNSFRLMLSHIEGSGGISDFSISASPKVERYEEKSLAKMFSTPLPLWNEYQWSQQPESDQALNIDPVSVVNITKNLAADGTLTWNVPAGDWIIMRYGMLPTGVPNSPASPEARGLEIDKINNTAMAHHFDSFVGKVQKSLSAEDGKSLKWVVADSYETGSQNWTDGMAEAFKNKYGYDALPWLPVLSGRVVKSQDLSDRFLWDLRRLIADRVAYQYVAGLRKVSHEHGMKIWLENYGHWGFPSEFLMYGGQTDEVAGEFWNEGTLGSIECRAASSAAHIYGKTKVAAESFTAGGMGFQRYPALLKKRGDWSFTEGINNTLFHVFIEQPYENKNPGVDAGFGTEFNRKNTWFYQGKAFVDYERRCNYMLQQGLAVNDVAYFIGEDAPKMTGVRDPELPKGYSFDYINAEVLEQRVTVKDGKLVLPDGMSYRLLVLPKLKTMRPALLQKIKQLVADGATILGPAPERSPSMQDFPSSDAQVKQLASEIWGAQNESTHSYGKGTVLTDMSMQDALNMLHVVPDFSLNDKPVLYMHRTTKEGELYFITNQSEETIDIAPAFRVTGKQPEWWDAVTGDARVLPAYTQSTTSTQVPLHLQAYQSGFVVFRKNAAAASSNKENFPAPSVITSLKGPWTVRFDKAQGGPDKPVVFKELIDWSTSDNEQIKNYSGTAFYTTDFTVNKIPSGEKIYLNLGMVKVMAKVKVNGVDMGSAWTTPYQVDISSAIKKGVNKVEVEVVNTWVNRLIGDSKLPAADRKTWTNVNIYTPDSKYEPSGLIGPVAIESVKY